ncbi:hypothetical protein L2E82_44683 [Cichorium intybus]|uniref:Uncharacterized protein n=1 Tax=Cichorium intybus TaxID=13427 RepID=A0ACB8ZS79_CICIN|nr:hypothetical protein L2E82_44683 [Cichorium intybus]
MVKRISLTSLVFSHSQIPGSSAYGENVPFGKVDDMLLIIHNHGKFLSHTGVKMILARLMFVNILLSKTGVRQLGIEVSEKWKPVLKVSDPVAFLDWCSTCDSIFICFCGISSLVLYNENLRILDDVCIIYDPSKSNQGVLALKALKLFDSFMGLYRKNEFNGEKLCEKNLTWVDIFERFTYIKVSNSALVSAFMTELNPIHLSPTK